MLGSINVQILWSPEFSLLEALHFQQPRMIVGQYPASTKTLIHCNWPKAAVKWLLVPLNSSMTTPLHDLRIGTSQEHSWGKTGNQHLRWRDVDGVSDTSGEAYWKAPSPRSQKWMIALLNAHQFEKCSSASRSQLLYPTVIKTKFHWPQ